MLPGMQPRPKPIIPSRSFTGAAAVTSESSSYSMGVSLEVEEDEEFDESLLKRSSVRNLDSLRADPKVMQQFLNEKVALVRAVSKSSHMSMHDDPILNTTIKDSIKSTKDINTHAIRLIQYCPEWSVFVYLASLGARTVGIENSSLQTHQGVALPLLIHGPNRISGRNAILQYLNGFNLEESLDFNHSGMACFVEMNCNLAYDHLMKLQCHDTATVAITSPWGLKYISTLLLSRFSTASPSLFTHYSEDQLLEHLDTSYAFLSYLTSMEDQSASASQIAHFHINEPSPQKDAVVLQNEQDAFSIADALLYGHLAQILFTFPTKAQAVLRNYKQLVGAFSFDSRRFLSRMSNVSLYILQSLLLFTSTVTLPTVPT
jgi:hypothetical protein